MAVIKRNEMFTGWSQNDVSEFLIFIIECFHKSMPKPYHIVISGIDTNDVDRNAMICYKMLQEQYEREYSEIFDIFYAIRISEITSLDKVNIYSKKPEEFFILDLPIPSNVDNVTIIHCLDLLTNCERLDNESSWYNGITKTHQSVCKKLSFWSLPKILVV